MKLADLWQKWLTLYSWLGGHPTVAGLIIGAIAGFVAGKAL